MVRLVVVAAVVFVAVGVVRINLGEDPEAAAAGSTISSQKFYVDSVTATPSVALRDGFANSGGLNARTVPLIDPNGGTTFGTTTALRPVWATSDTAWTMTSSSATHGASGAPSTVRIPWLSQSSYVQALLVASATTSNAGIGILCDSSTTCIGARLRYATSNYYLDLGELSSGVFTAAATPTCTSGAVCSVSIGASVSTSTNLRIDYNASTYVATMTFGANTLSMTVPAGYRTNTKAGLYTLANSDGTRFDTFQVGKS
ncbi:MAG: hypothetical protein U0R64_04345 [Candidatus Nanopelagicales bacterium]